MQDLAVHQIRAIFYQLSSVTAALSLWGKATEGKGPFLTDPSQRAQPYLHGSCELYYSQSTGNFQNSKLSLVWTCNKEC